MSCKYGKMLFLVVFMILFSYSFNGSFSIVGVPTFRDWSSPVVLMVGDDPGYTSASSRGLAVDSQGCLHVVTYEGASELDFNIYYWTNKNGSWGWSNISEVNAAFGPQRWPVIAVDVNDIVHIVWAGFVNGQYDLFYVNNSGGVWSAPYNITGTLSLNESYPSMVVDSLNRLHVAALACNDSVREILYTYKNTSGYWFNPVNITDPVGFDGFEEEGLSIDVDSYSHVYVAFAGKISSAVDVFIVNNSLGVWSAPLNVSRDGGGYDAFPSIGVDSNDVVHICWGSGRGYWPWVGEVKYVNISAGVLGSPVSISGSGYWAFFTSMYIDSRNVVHIAYSQWIGEVSANEIYYVNNMFGVFGNSVNVSRNAGCDDIYPQLIVDSEGVAHIVYTAAFRVVYTRNYSVEPGVDLILPVIVVGVVVSIGVVSSLVIYFLKIRR